VSEREREREREGETSAHGAAAAARFGQDKATARTGRPGRYILNHIILYHNIYNTIQYNIT
jgi:hypothetical protein